MGRIATLPCTMAVVRCPSLPAAINTEKGEDKKGREFLRKRGTNRGGNFGRAEGSKLQKRKKKGKPEGAKLLRNELEGRNKFEKGDRGGLQRSRNRGGGFRVQS
jgi:hypothetical protein